MPSEKHQQKAQELLSQIITTARCAGAYKALDMIAAALEAVERETEVRVKSETAIQCAEIADGAELENTEIGREILRRAVRLIRREFGIAEKEIRA